VVTVTAIYLAYLAAMALTVAVTEKRGRLAVVVSLIALVSILRLGMPYMAPLIYLLIGYWLPGLLIGAPNVRFEQRLARFDRVLFAPDDLDAFVRKAPRALLEYFEGAYLLCYAVVPLGFAWFVRAGYEYKADLFWSAVLLASFGCYGLLPWLPTRAPRALEGAVAIHERTLIRRVNLYVLDRASVQWNTFPSGHTAASMAVALVVGSETPLAGVAFGLIAVSIAVGSVIGRYHYAADAIAGGLVAILAFLAASAAHAP